MFTILEKEPKQVLTIFVIQTPRQKIIIMANWCRYCCVLAVVSLALLLVASLLTILGHTARSVIRD